MTREDWMMAIVEQFRTAFFNGEITPELPKVRVSCGFPKIGRKTVGECWSSKCSGDHTFEIFVHPGIDEGLRVADVLLHECIHAAVGIKCGHRGEFKIYALKVGLEGSMKETVAGPELKEKLRAMIAQVGDYPHAKLVAAAKEKKQDTRMLKLQCHGCDMVIRTTQKWLDDIGAPMCACGHNEPFIKAD